MIGVAFCGFEGDFPLFSFGAVKVIISGKSGNSSPVDFQRDIGKFPQQEAVVRDQQQSSLEIGREYPI